MHRVSLWDRIVWGAIAGLAGCAVGTAIALAVIYERQLWQFNRALVLFSGFYFFAAGFWKGPLAADLFGGAAQGAAGLAQVEAGAWLQDDAFPKTIPSERAVELLGVGYVIGALAVLWYFW